MRTCTTTLSPYEFVLSKNDIYKLLIWFNAQSTMTWGIVRSCYSQNNSDHLLSSFKCYICIFYIYFDEQFYLTAFRHTCSVKHVFRIFPSHSIALLASLACFVRFWTRIVQRTAGFSLENAILSSYFRFLFRAPLDEPKLISTPLPNTRCNKLALLVS